MWKYAAAGLALSLSACTTMGVASKQALRDEFEAPMPVSQVYRRAQEQAELCLRGASGHQVEAELDAAGRSAQVYVRAPFTRNRLVNVDIQALDAGRSRVSVAMWGVNIWDQKALWAMREAVLIGIPTCRSYMPPTDHRARGR